MKSVCRLVLVAGLSAVVLLPALPELAAQHPCQYAMQVHTYHMQMQQQVHFQQMQHQQMQMHQYHLQQQQQMMQLHQQHLQMVHQANQLQQHKMALQTQQQMLSRTTGHLQNTVHHLSTNQQCRVVPITHGNVGRPPTALVHNHSNVLTGTNTQLHIQTNHLAKVSQQLHTPSRTLSTTALALHTQAKTLTTVARQLHTTATALHTGSTKLSTQTRTVCTGKDVTVVTINWNCASCHRHMQPTGGGPNMPTALTRLAPSGPRMPVARFNPPALPKPVGRQPQPPMMVARLPQPPVMVGRQPQLPMMGGQQPKLSEPVARNRTHLLTPVAYLRPQPPGLPQFVQQPPPNMVLPPQGMPLPQFALQPPTNLPIGLLLKSTPPLLPEIVTRPTSWSAGLPTMIARKKTPRKEMTPTTSTRPDVELPAAVEAPRSKLVLTKEMLELPPALLVPVTAPSEPVGSDGRLLTGVLPESEPTTKEPVLSVVHDDGLERPPLPPLLRSVWVLPAGAPTGEPIEDFDRTAPSFAGDAPVTTRPASQVKTTATTRAPVLPGTDAPPLLPLPPSIRTAS